MSDHEMSQLDERLRSMETHLAGMRCVEHDGLLRDHDVILHGSPGNGRGLVTRVSTLETRADYTSRWLNALWGIFAGLIVSLASAGVIAVVSHVSRPSSSDQQSSGQSSSPAPSKGHSP